MLDVNKIIHSLLTSQQKKKKTNHWQKLPMIINPYIFIQICMFIHT